MSLFQKLTYLFLWLTIFTVPFQKSFIIPGIGSLNKAVGIALVSIAIFTLLMQKEFKKIPLFLILLFMFILLNIASYFWAVIPADALDKSLLFLQLAFIAWAIYEFSSDKERLDGLIKAFVLGCAFIAIQSIFQYLTGGYQSVSTTRFFVEGYNPNALGTIWALALPMAIYLTINRYKIYSLYIPIAIYSILLTGSRTGFILLGFVAISAIWLLFKYRIRFRKTIILSLVIVCWFVISLMPSGQLERLSTVEDEISGGTLNGRTIIWEAGIDTFKDNPILGVGAGSYLEASVANSATGQGASAHSSYLSVLVENGLIGFVLFVGMLSILIFSAFIIDKNNPYRWLSLTLIIAWMILSIVSHAEAQKYTWIIFGMVITSYYVSKKPIEVKEKQPKKRRFKRYRIVW